MTTSQQRRSGRHAVPPDDAQDDAPVVPPQRAASTVAPRADVCRTPSVRPAGPPLTVAEYAERMRSAPAPVWESAPEVVGPQFGEWPYGRSNRFATAGSAPAPGDGVGRGALVFGGLGLLVALVPLLALVPSAAGLPVVGLPATGLAAFPLVVVGLLLGVLGTERAASRRLVAVTGTALATAGLTLCVLWATLIVVALLASPASAGDVVTALTSGTG